MVSFFERLQKASRNYGDSISVYLRTHPLTTERIADMEARARLEPYRQHADSTDFNFVRIRARLLQDSSAGGMNIAEAEFAEMIKSGSRFQASAGYYGRTIVALKQKNADQATVFFQETKRLIGDRAAQTSLALAGVAIDIKIAANKPEEAAKEAQAALSRFPTSRALAYQYANALILAGNYDRAMQYLRRQAQIYRSDPVLRSMLAKVYNAQGKVALAHLELAESYSLSGGLSSALEQLSLARQAPDVTFYDHSIIDAREREWKARRLEEMQGR
jgi:predicted Zn-dependent protease